MAENTCNRTIISEEDRRAMLELADLALQSLEEKCRRLERLFESGYTFEAWLLCCCYIDGAATWGWGGEIAGSKRRFVEVLAKHGGEAALAAIHPKQLRCALSCKKGLKSIAEKIKCTLKQAEGRLYSEDEIVARVGKPDPNEDDVRDLIYLRDNLWRGTLAAIVYQALRCELVHEMSGPDAISFEQTTFNGEPLPPIDFCMLYRCLQRILAEVRRRFLARGLEELQASGGDEAT